MKVIALERIDGSGVAITRPSFGQIIGMQSGLDAPAIVELQRALFGIPEAEIVRLLQAFDVAPGKEIEIAGPDGVSVKKLTVKLTRDAAMTAYADYRLANDVRRDPATGEPLDPRQPLYRRYVFVDEAALPPRETRDSWRLVDGGLVVAAGG